MTIKTATPYLMIPGGKAEQAIALYKQALGATVETLMRYGDIDQSCPAATKDRVMHAVLRIGSATVMISDDPVAEAHRSGGNISVALDFDDADQARKCFDALSAGGTVIEKLMEAPWGALFGSLGDAYGVSWMFNCELKRG